MERLIQLSEERENLALMTELPEQWEVTPEPGWVEPALAEEFPGLSIASTTVETTSGRSPEALRRDCGSSATASAGRRRSTCQQPIPWAYRVFFRHIGLDPDTTRTPIEQLIFDRMHDGRFKSRNRVDDALTIAMVEVGSHCAPSTPIPSTVVLGCGSRPGASASRGGCRRCRWARS